MFVALTFLQLTFLHACVLRHDRLNAVLSRSVRVDLPLRKLRTAHVRQLRVSGLRHQHRLGARSLPMRTHPHHHDRHVLLQVGRM